MTVQTTASPTTATRPATEDERQLEWSRCAASPIYFTNEYVQIEDAIARRWIRFKLWIAQARTLKIFQLNRLVVVLKARQVGLTWLALSYALWLMIFHPAAVVLLFSRRDDEAMELLDRLRGMYTRLPSWMQAREVTVDNAHELALSNGSRARAFPTTAGDSYTATLVIGDEFDLVPNQDKLMRSVQPAIDNGGQMILLSRPDKDRPLTRFKKIYRAAVAGLTDWVAVFLPWYVHPGRDVAWYAAKRADILESTGSEDELHEQYPATDAEALQGRTLNKRIAPSWLNQCYDPLPPLIVVGRAEAQDGDLVIARAPAIPGLKIWRLPEAGRHYVMGADPAEGLPASDDSSLTVVDKATGEEVARLDGKYEPKAVFPGQIIAIGRFYNHAPVIVERQNHGHAVIGHIQASAARIRVLNDPADQRTGWNNTTMGKVRLYDIVASICREMDCTVHDEETYIQLGSIDKNTLRAPEGEHDDKADSYALAQAARSCDPTIDFAFV